MSASSTTTSQPPLRNPELVGAEPAIAPPNTLGLRQIMFAVEDIDDTVSRLHAHGAELVGEVVQYEDRYRLCCMRGPAGIIVALAEELPDRARPSALRTSSRSASQPDASSSW